MDNSLNDAAPICSERLILVPMTVEFHEACLAGNRAGASQLIGLETPPDWLLNRQLMEIRLAQLRREPDLLPWLVRAVGLRHEPVMIGHIGFHTRPGADYLSRFAPGGVELGYTIYPNYRKQGYASEASAALMDWAQHEHQVARFVVSISPQNEPSLRLARKFGFSKVGTQIDDEDGPEDIYVRQAPAYNG